MKPIRYYIKNKTYIWNDQQQTDDNVNFVLLNLIQLIKFSYSTSLCLRIGEHKNERKRRHFKVVVTN